MKMMDSDYEIVTKISAGGIKELQLIERAGRECYKSGDKITSDGESAKRFVKMLIDNHHEAMLEHSFLTVKFTVDRGVSHEFVRHRIASFAQESTRYCSYDKDKFGNEIAVIDILEGIEFDPKMQKMDGKVQWDILCEWKRAMEDAEKHYMKMIELGATPQIARSVLPNSTKTTLVISANYREWRNILKLRCDKSAHPQIRSICLLLLCDLKNKIPVVFDDIDGSYIY